MSKLIGGLALLMASALFLVSADAQEGDKGKGKFKGKGDAGKFAEATFKKLDANSDGRLSREEFLKMADRAKDAEKGEKFRDLLAKAFDKADTEMKGLSLDQFKEIQTKLFDKLKEKKKKNDQ